MLHTVPIYYCNIEVINVKTITDFVGMKAIQKEVVLDKYFIEKMVLKGYHPKDILDKNLQTINKHLKKNDRVNKIILVKQLGYGLDE